MALVCDKDVQYDKRKDGPNCDSLLRVSVDMQVMIHSSESDVYNYCNNFTVPSHVLQNYTKDN